MLHVVGTSRDLLSVAVKEGQLNSTGFTRYGGTVTRPRQESVKERRITSPILSVSIDEEIARLKSEPEWTSGRIDGIALVKYPRMRVVLVALKKETSMRQHKVEGPLSIYVISGKVSVVTEKGDFQVQAKGLFTMRQRFLNEVRAMADSVFLLTLFKLES